MSTNAPDLICHRTESLRIGILGSDTLHRGRSHLLKGEARILVHLDRYMPYIRGSKLLLHHVLINIASTT